MKPSTSSTSSSKYRVHAPDPAPPETAQPRSARSRGSGSRHIGDPRDQEYEYSSTGAPVTDYSLYDPRAYTAPIIERQVIDHQSYPSGHSYQIASQGIVSRSHQRPHQHLNPHHVHPQAYPPQHQITYPNYEPPNYEPPTPPLPQGHRKQSYPSSQSLTPYFSGQSHHPHSRHQSTSHSSDLSQYSTSQSQYKQKHRFRIEQEGQNLIVLPSKEVSLSHSSHSSHSSTSLSSPVFSPLALPAPGPPQPASRIWPPTPHQTGLSPAEAKIFVGDGAPKFKGELREISNGPRGHYHLFAFSGDQWDEESDTITFQSDSFCDMSSSPEGKQTDALERPAMAHAFGIYPGTVTLAFYVATFGSNFRGSEVAARGKVRKLTMLYVLDRLRALQVKGVDEDPVELHHHLYNNLLHDIHKYEYPQTQFSLDSQISDLVAALCRPSWVDFSLIENQTIARFLADPTPGVANSFFHQLLLSIELYLRIKARTQTSMAVKPLGDMPEKINWDLILAQRWLENVEVEPPKKVKDSKGKREQKSSVGFKFPNKKNQVEALRNFAWTLKWPNMHEVEYTLSEEEDPNELLEDRSINCMSWFTGLLLPGKSMPWILMNALTDCDPDVPDDFHDLTPATPNVGMQYRGHTYWSCDSIVGKVLGAAFGVSQIAGWIGPCSASADLDRSEMAVINQAPPRGNRITPSDVRAMAQNSDPLGAHQPAYSVDDYLLLLPNVDEAIDSIRIERLNFSPSARNPKGIHSVERVGENGQPPEKKPIVIFDASITFAITVDYRARSWKVSLRYDTPFIAAYPCQKGPHVLFCEYQHRMVKVDKLVDIQNWGSAGGRIEAELEGDEGSESNMGVEEVLVVEAYGVSDNEVFARAWCAFWGLPAITADINRTCMACAIREAYAALVSVVILTNRGSINEEVEEVDRLMKHL